MKAVIPKTQFLGHIKTLKVGKPKKSVGKAAMITLAVSDSFSVNGMGFCHELTCQAIEKGNVTLPYIIWEKILWGLENDRGEEVIIAAENGRLRLNNREITHDQIRVAAEAELPFEIPLNATPKDIIRLVFLHGPERFKAAGMWRTVTASMDHLRHCIDQASSSLKDYGVLPEDFAECVARRLAIDDYDKFAKILFPDKS